MKKNRILFVVVLLCIHINTIAQTPVTYNLGQKSVDFSYSHTQNTIQTNNSYVGQASNDVWYEFTLTEPFEIDIAASSTLPGTWVYLLRKDTKALLKSSNSKAPQIHTGPLMEGSYYVVSEGTSIYNGSITTKITGKKLTPVKYNVGAKSGYFEYTHTQDTRQTNNCYAPEPGNDVWYEFTLLKELEVEVSVTTKLSGCKVTLMDGSKKFIKSQVGATFSIKAGKLAPGKYYVVSEGLSSNNGEITTTIKGYPIEPVVYGLGSKSVDFSYTHTQDTRQTNNSYVGYTANDVFYQFTLTAEMDLEISASTKLPSCCIYLLNSSKALLKTERGMTPTIKVEKLPKGTYYIVTEGTSGGYNGEFTTNIKGKLSNPVTYSVGTKSTDFSYSHTQNTASTSNHYVGQESNDVWYEFTLTEPLEIDIFASSSMPGTCVYLLRKDTKELLKSSSGKAPQILAGTLTAGSYYIVSEGLSVYNGSITTRITGKKLIPVTYNIGSKSGYFEYIHTQNTTETNNSYVGQASNDVWYEFTLLKELRIEAYATTKLSSSSYLYLLDSSKNLLKRSLASVPSISESKLAPGKYYIVLEGANGNNGEIKTTIKGYPKEPVVHVVGTKSVDFSYTHIQNTAQTNNSYVGNSSNDVSYQLHLLEEMDLEISASTKLPSCCIYLLNSSKNLLKTEIGLSPVIKAEKLAKGTYYIVAEGKNGYDGEITTTIKGKLSNPVTHIVGTKSTDFSYSHTQNTNSTSNHYMGQESNDVWYEFTLTGPFEIDIAASSSMPGTCVYLLRKDTKALIKSSSGKAPEIHPGTLMAGSYYVVSEGLSVYNGSITTKITGKKISAKAEENYIKVVTPQIKTDDAQSLKPGDCFETVQYYDAFGRSTQTVEVGVTVYNENLVTLQQYDGYGRAEKSWLPVPVENRNAYPIANYGTESSNYYGDSHPYTKVTYENSPLNRVIKTIDPGQKWHNAGKGIQEEHLINSSTGVLSLDYYYIHSNGLPVYSGTTHSPGTHSVQKVTDEDGNVQYFFTNLLGQLILHRQMNGTGEELNTYYLYDDFGNKRYVLPPMVNRNCSPSNIDDFAYRYTYDYRDRCIETKFPGVAPVYYVYDKSGRMVISQDGNQRSGKMWTLYKYDKLGRLLYTAEMYHAHTHQQLREYWDDRLMLEDFSTGTLSEPLEDTGYSKNLYHLAIRRILNVYYYDNYEFLKLLPAAGKTALTFTAESGYDAQYTNATGMLTGTRSYYLESTGYTATAHYYDKSGNEVQKISSNHMGGYEKNFYNLSFTGRTNKHKKQHTATGKSTITEVYTYSYDHGGRLMKTMHQVNGEQPVLLAENEYDEIGRLISKKLHSNKEIVNYNYNIRNWLTYVGGANFSQRLSYDYYNGNISSYQWQIKSENWRRQYNFKYDGVNRLTEAQYGEFINNISYVQKNDYTVKINAYDKNGNIKSLTRYGVHTLPASAIEAPGVGIIDNLTMSYKGNQLSRVVDTAPYDPVYYGAMHFIDGVDESVEYFYDSNGNMIKDMNHDIETTYNLLNLPSNVFTGGNKVSTTYDARGNKMETQYTHALPSSVAISAPIIEMQNEGIPEVISPFSVPPRPMIEYMDYCGNILYKGSTLDKIMTSEGYIDKDSNGKFVYHYFLRDHQGNVRVVINQNAEAEQVNHYYPFGGLFGISTDKSGQRYKYNEKELDRMFGLDLYDYTARSMRSTIGRFNSMDPLAEKFYSISPYAYCGNNPILNIDPTGEAYWSTTDPEQIKRFLEAAKLSFDKKTPFESFDYSGWKYASDEEFVETWNNLTYNDETKMFHSSYGTVIDGEVHSIGVSAKAEDYGGSATMASRGWMSQGGNLKQVNIEFEILTVAAGIFKQLGKAAVKTTTKALAKKESKTVITASESRRIQNASTRINKKIHVVGSRANGKSNAYSDWDYIIEGGLTNREWKKIKNSLPGSKSVIDNLRRNIDIIKEPLDPTKTHITFTP